VCSVGLPLARFTSLHTLRLHFEHNTRHVLSLSLSTLAHLRSFTLGASTQGDVDAAALFAPLATLTLLHVSAFRISDRGAFLTALSALADLRMHQAFVEEAPQAILSPYLTALSRLTALALESNSALGGYFDSLGRTLTQLSSLARLRFRDNHECAESPSSALFSQLAALSRLQVRLLCAV
jgi:hypothetical protein